jgi:murein DD-endopeptidase MepM/ murein hydrolase activator NlpD
LRRALILAFVLVVSLSAAGTAVAAEAPTEFKPGDIAFPVGGDEYRITDSFGDCRGADCSRSHEGVDIMAPKGTPIYAAAAGVADWVSTTQEDCCRLEIDHAESWSTRYLHLNDDTKDDQGKYTSDDLGWGIVEGIVDGTPISKGQLIGWVGDSGNATEGVTHLHFELLKDDVAIDGYPYLLKAAGIVVYQFNDTVDSTHRDDIEKIYQAGITYGCNPPDNTLFCPQREITRGEMAAFITRTLGLSALPESVPYDDVAGDTFEGDIARLHAAGIAFGCDADSYCPDRPLLREEMAELLVRGFGYENPDGIDAFVDDEESAFEESINKLANSGVTYGCNPPDNTEFCPERTLTRAEMASFFARALDL